MLPQLAYEHLLSCSRYGLHAVNAEVQNFQ